MSFDLWIIHRFAALWGPAQVCVYCAAHTTITRSPHHYYTQPTPLLHCYRCVCTVRAVCVQCVIMVWAVGVCVLCVQCLCSVCVRARVFACVYRACARVCVCRHFLDVFIDMPAPMLIHKFLGILSMPSKMAASPLRVQICVRICMPACVDVCADMCRRACRYAHSLVCRHVYGMCVDMWVGML